MGDDEGEPRRYTKAWIRANWDDERDTGPKNVQIVKLLHEWHIILLPSLFGAIGAVAIFLAGASAFRSALGFFPIFGYSFKLLFNNWWCSTLAETGSSREETESTSDDEGTAGSEADRAREQRQQRGS